MRINKFFKTESGKLANLVRTNYEKLKYFIDETTHILNKIYDIKNNLDDDENVKIFNETIYILREMIFELKKYNKINYSCILMLNTFYYKIQFIFKIIDCLEIKTDLLYLMLNVYYLFNEKER